MHLHWSVSSSLHFYSNKTFGRNSLLQTCMCDFSELHTIFSETCSCNITLFFLAVFLYLVFLYCAISDGTCQPFLFSLILSKNVLFFLLWLAPVGLSCTPVVNRNLKKRKPRSNNFKLQSWCNNPFYIICRTYIGLYCHAESLSSRVWGRWIIRDKIQGNLQKLSWFRMLCNA